MTVVVPGRAEPASPACERFTIHGTEAGERLGGNARAFRQRQCEGFASVTQMAMDNATLNGLARSGRDVRLYSSLDETRTAGKTCPPSLLYGGF